MTSTEPRGSMLRRLVARSGLDWFWGLALLCILLKSLAVLVLSWVKSPNVLVSLPHSLSPWVVASSVGAALLLGYLLKAPVERAVRGPHGNRWIAAASFLALVGAVLGGWAGPTMVYVSIAASFLAPVLVLPGMARGVAVLAVDTLISLVFLTDIWHFRAFDSYTSLHLLGEVGNLYRLGDSVLSMTRPADLLLVADLPFLAMLLWRRRESLRACRPALATAFMLPLLTIGCIYVYHYKVDVLENGQHAILFRTCWLPVQTLANLSPLGYHAHDAYEWYTQRQRHVITPGERERIQRWFAAKHEDAPPSARSGSLRGRNVLLIQVESLERFPVERTIDGQEITPTLNRLAREGLFFTNIQEQVHNGTSSDSDFMVNTSVYPIRQGSTFFRYPGNTWRSLPRLLEARGYHTMASHPDFGGYWNWMAGLTGVGFQRCIDRSEYRSDEEIGPGLSDATFLAQLRAKVREMPRPFYVFCVTLSSHAPFELEPRLRELRLPATLESTRLGHYFQSLHYTDKHIGALLEGLEEDGVLKDTVVVVEGDHGGVHKFYRAEIEAHRPQESWWQDPTSHVPLIVWARGFRPGRVERLGGQVDIMPTLADLLGIPEREIAWSAMGRNLLRTRKAFAVTNWGDFLGGPASEKGARGGGPRYRRPHHPQRLLPGLVGPSSLRLAAVSREPRNAPTRPRRQEAPGGRRTPSNADSQQRGRSPGMGTRVSLGLVVLCTWMMAGMACAPSPARMPAHSEGGGTARAVASPTAPVRPVPPTTAQAEGTRPHHAVPDKADIDELFEPLCKDGGPGAAVLVAQGGTVLFKAGYGLANLKTRARITPDSLFHLGSVGKQFTALGIMMLHEQGRLDYDDPIGKHLPELARFGTGLTIRHLLHHTSGIADYDADEALHAAIEDKAPFPSNSDLLAVLAHQGKALSAAGTRFRYSNTGYDVLGRAHRAPLRPDVPSLHAGAGLRSRGHEEHLRGARPPHPGQDHVHELRDEGKPSHGRPHAPLRPHQRIGFRGLHGRGPRPLRPRPAPWPPGPLHHPGRGLPAGPAQRRHVHVLRVRVGDREPEGASHHRP